MLDALKRWFSSGQVTPTDWSDVSAWARQQGWVFKPVKSVDGFAIDGMFGDMPWRMEWGPSQRAYIAGRELRLRMELKLPQDLQMLVLSRSLMESLERATFEQFTQTSQTLIDSTTPEEMRWLAMYPKVNLSSTARLRHHFGAVASEPAVGLSWVEGALADHIESAARRWLSPDKPFVLMTLRGRLYLRLQQDLAQPGTLADAIRLFDVAAQNARRVVGVAAPSSTEWPSTAITAWQALEADDTRSDERSH